MYENESSGGSQGRVLIRVLYSLQGLPCSCVSQKGGGGEGKERGVFLYTEESR